jgi:AbrB family looped-hinge helix DNA binding protein
MSSIAPDTVGANTRLSFRRDMVRVHYVRIVSGNRITLPEDIRDALRLKVGDYVRVEWDRSKGIIVSPAEG